MGLIVFPSPPYPTLTNISQSGTEQTQLQFDFVLGGEGGEIKLNLFCSFEMHVFD